MPDRPTILELRYRVIITLTGLALVAAGWFLARPDTISNAKVTAGEVTQVNESYSRSRSGSRGTKVFSPTITYTVDAKNYSISDDPSSSTKVTVGDTVEVEYDASNPQRARWTGSPHSWGWMGVIGFGVFFLLIAAVLSYPRLWSAPAPE